MLMVIQLFVALHWFLINCCLILNFNWTKPEYRNLNVLIIILTNNLLHPKLMKKQITILVAFLLAVSMVTSAQKKHSLTTEYPTYKGLVMAGYQGWFIQRDGKMYPNAASIRIDMWPDMREYKLSYPTGLKYADGTTATFFSATDKSTIDLHFKWMKQYGIDGVFMQRFFNYARPGSQQRKIYSKMFSDALESASKYKRAIAVEYDLSGLRATGEDCTQIIEDWKYLVDSIKVTNQKGKHTYLFHNGKPLVAIWGIGFPDRPYNIQNIGLIKLLDFLKNDPVYGGCSVLLGVPTYWRELGRDCVNDPYLHEIIKMADIVLPWMVGRFKEESYDAYKENISKDLAWCKQNKLDYVPVVWPGFSWHNLKKTTATNDTPRNGGSFLWKQMYNSINLGCEMLFVAMFDEVNEGTAIFKVTNDPPVGEGLLFVGLEGKPSDHYLWLTGEAGKMLRKEKPLSAQMPERKK
jgi:hypothetical protein